MSSTQAQSPQPGRNFGTAASDDYQRLNEILANAGYNDAGVVKALGVDNLARLRDRKLPVLLRRVSGQSRLETLIRLFILGQPADLTSATSAFAPMSVDRWADIGLVEMVGSQVRPAVQLRCYQGLVLAYDFPRRSQGGLPHDYVMGVSSSSLVLAGMTVRRTNRSALDLGTGCGIQGILAASHSARVVAVDCNPRAAAICRFNAQLNRIENLQVREGDMFGPVAGEAFDLIVSNPPFIISPENRHFFLNSGLEGDEICRRIVRQAPPFLSEGGYCVFNANWAVIEQEDWYARLAGWFEGTGCDGLVIRQEIHDVGEYAASFIETGDNDRAEFSRIFDEWMDYYARRKITGIGQGVIVMRRASARRNWFAVDTAPRNIAFPSGEDVTRLVELRTFLSSLSDERALLDVRLKLASNVRLEQVCEAVDGAWREVSCALQRVGGLEYRGSVDAPSAAVLSHFDGDHSVSDQLASLAVALNADLTSLTPSALATVRRLVEQGFLVPADAAS